WDGTRQINGHRERYQAANEYQSRNRGESHSDRIMRRRNEKSRSDRYGENRYGRGPYDRKEELSWRVKVQKAHKKHGEIEEHVSGGSRGNKRLASAIVTPAHQRPPQDENVTI
ncbi:unnamed protein product, partial [Brassica rapa]